jgi:hypothetical protein
LEFYLGLAYLKFHSTLWYMIFENNKIPDENFKSLLLSLNKWIHSN